MMKYDNSSKNIRELRPLGLRKNKDYLTNKYNVNKPNTAQIKRKEYVYSDEFSNKYNLPYKLYDNYINNKSFNIEYYSIENIEQRALNMTRLYNRCDIIYNEYVDSYIDYVYHLSDNSFDFNNFFYEDEVFIDDSLNEYICSLVQQILKREFKDDYFNPFINE
jgi:hypothetical protein